MAKDSSINIAEISRQVNKKIFSPVYLFYGDEKYLIDEIVDTIIEKSIDENLRQLNVEKYSCNDVDSETFINAALSIPMLSEKKVVIVKDYQKVNDSKSLQHYFENPPNSTILILIAESIDKRKNVFSKASVNGVVASSESLKKKDIVDWICARVSKCKKKIDTDVAEILFELKGNSLQELFTEIEKLITYTFGKDIISKDDVLNVIGSTREFNIFEFINTIGKNDKQQTLNILEHLLDQGVEPLFILAMLNRHFLILWKASMLKKQIKNPSEMTSALQISPFFIKDYLSQTEKFSIARIEKCLACLLESDLQLKSVSLQKRIIIENLIYQLLDSNNLIKDFKLSNFKVSIEI